jgi:hypothetical protein
MIHLNRLDKLIFLLCITLIGCSNHDFNSYQVKHTGPSAEISDSIGVNWDNACTGYISKAARGNYNRENEQDISGVFKVLWDDENLYFLFDITDDIKLGSSDFSAYYDNIFFQMDGIQLYLDMDNDKSRFNDEFNGKNYRYNFCYHVDKIESTNGSMDGVEFYQEDDSKGYIFKIKMPWGTLNFDPKSKKKFRCEIHLTDCDDTRLLSDGFFDGTETIMTWQEDYTELEAKNSHSYGTMYLVN